MKRVLAILLVLVLALSLTGCLSKEEKAEVAKKEKEATIQINAYLKDNYPGFKVVKAEQLVRGNLLEGFHIEDVTEFTVRDKKDNVYKFYYDSEADDVYSNVNYNKILNELEDMLNDNDFIEDADSGETAIYICNEENFNAVLDKHDSLKDIIKYIDKGNTTTYSFASKFYYKNLKNLEPEDLEIDVDIYGKLTNYELHIYNVTQDYSKLNPQECHVIDSIHFYDNAFSNAERKLIITHNHHKIKEIDDLYYSYDDRYANFDIEKSDTYKETDLFEYNSTYKPLNRGYDVALSIKDSTKVEYGDVVTEYRNKNNLLISVRDEDVIKATVFFDTVTYKDCIAYRHLDQRIDQFFDFDEYESVYFYCHDGYLSETISLMKKVVEK